MSFLDKMKKKAEELELDKKAKDLQEAATTAAKQAREKAGDFTAENRNKIDGYVEKAATTIDAKTEGKYADKVAKAKQHGRQGRRQGRGGLTRTAQRTSRPAPQPVAHGSTGGFACGRDGFAASPSTFPVDPGRSAATRFRGAAGRRPRHRRTECDLVRRERHGIRQRRCVVWRMLAGWVRTCGPRRTHVSHQAVPHGRGCRPGTHGGSWRQQRNRERLGALKSTAADQASDAAAVAKDD